MEASRQHTPRPVSSGVGESGGGGGVGGGNQGFFWEEEEPDRPVILTESSGPNSPSFVALLVGFTATASILDFDPRLMPTWFN